MLKELSGKITDFFLHYDLTIIKKLHVFLPLFSAL